MTPFGLGAGLSESVSFGTAISAPKVRAAATRSAISGIRILREAAAPAPPRLALRGRRRRRQGNRLCGWCGLPDADQVLGLGDRLATGCGHGRSTEVAGGGEPVRGVLGHRPADHGVECSSTAAPGSEGRRRLVEVGPHLGRALALRERDLAGDRVEEDATEGVDVGPRVDPAPLYLLRRHVVDCADHLARGGQPASRGRDLRESEVREERRRAVVSRPGFSDEHVRGLDVAVHEAGRMDRIESVGHLRDQRGRLVGGQRAVGRGQPPEIAPGHVSHGHEQQSVALAGAEDRDHPRMLDRGCGARFLAEPRSESLVLGELRPDHLQRDIPVEPDLSGQVDDSHPSVPEGALDPEAGELGAGGQPGAAPDRSLGPHQGHPVWTPTDPNR